MQSAPAPPGYTHFQLPGDLDIAVNSNKKMKTVLVSVSVIGNLNETVTRMAILPSILRRGTRRHPDLQAISRYLDGLYGASLSSQVFKLGEWHLLRFRLDVVNERFVPGVNGLLGNALEFLSELMRDPLVVEGGFHPQYLEQEKANQRRAIESLLDNKAAYAENRCIEEMCSKEPFHLFELGRVEDIEAIDAKELRELHRRWSRRYPVHAYLAGDVDPAAARDLATSVFAGGAAEREGGYALSGPPSTIRVAAPREVEERMDVNQAKLVLGFRHGVTYSHPSYEALLLMNGILGGYSHSKLFQNVREKESLCYSIHSSLERVKGLLFISSGIAPENYRKAVDIILKNVESMKAGQITDEEIQATILTILNANEMLEDNFGALADVDLAWRLHDRPFDLLEFRRRLTNVQRDEIVAAARLLQHDTTYLLTR
ncbi:MAG TPA: pitrilysin family protein [Planctomycetota bacterium]|nr:pitrilysin family protein [Planctomycetota bacterium]